MTWTIEEIARATGLDAEGDLALPVARPADPRDAGEADLALAMSPGYAAALEASPVRAAVLWPGADWRAMGLRAALFAPRPRPALAELGDLFAQDPELEPGIHPTAVIGPDARLGADARIGPFVVIGRGARIGDGARIMAHATVGPEARLGPGATLHPGVRIGGRVTIGAGFIAHPNAVIGADGFSFLSRAADGPEVDATPRRIASLGTVTIGDAVELGAGSAIDRGTVSDTCVGSGSKIDNLVQVGHNVRIGRDCLVCGQAGIAGSAEIGDRVILGGRAAVSDHVVIGADCMVAGGSLVTGDVPPGSVMMGPLPALPREAFTRQLLALRRLPRLAAQLRQVRKTLGL